MRKQHDRRTWTTIRVTPYKQEDIPEKFMLFAKRRVDFLKGAAFNNSLDYLLACAYLQGINDAVEAHVRNPTLFAPEAIIPTKNSDVI